jgi:hypothetical protein
MEFQGGGGFLELEADGRNLENYQCRDSVLIRATMRSWVHIPKYRMFNLKVDRILI